MSFTPFSNTIYLTGRLRTTKTNNQTPNGGLSVFVKGNHIIMAKSKTNAKGVFHFYWNDDINIIYYYFYCVTGKDTVLIGKVNKFTSEDPDLTFYLPEPVH
jgi:hypothetical protein